MSKALKCDRCNVCFDPWTAADEFATLNNIVYQDKTAWANVEVTYRDEELHLCPDCTKEFTRFLSEKRKIPHPDQKPVDEAKKPEPFRFSAGMEDPFSAENINRYVTRLHNILTENRNKKEDK